jgi:hypothetical protein
MLCKDCRCLVSRGAAYCGSCGEPISGGPAPLELVLRDGSRVPLVETVTIGRAPGNTIRLSDPSVSRCHARILAYGDLTQVEDVGSSHGTFLDGRQLAGPEDVKDGACIELGDCILRVERRRDDTEAGRTIVVRPGVTVTVPAAGEPVASSSAAYGLHPRLRSGWALKRLAVAEGERRYVLKEIRGERFMDVAADEAALFELLDGRATLPELIADAERRLGSRGASRLARLLAELAGRADSLDAMLRRWSDFVTEVERGYDDSIYEYTNDLSVRDRLERVVQGAGPRLRAELEGSLAEDDRRFEAATEESARPLGEFGEASPPWWWRRMPRRRVGELAEDLESLGYVGR